MKHLLDTRLNKVTNQDLVEVNAVWPFSNLHLDKLNWCFAFLFLVKTLRTLTPHPYYCYHWQQRGRKKEEAMSCCEERPKKGMKGWAPTIHLNIGFVVGVLFMLLIYLVVSQQAAISGLGGNNA